MLKETLRRIADQDFALPEGADAYTLVLKVAEALGSTDSELRDQLGYKILSNWFSLYEVSGSGCSLKAL